MPSDSQLLTDILAELIAIRKALESKPAQAPGGSPGTGMASDPIIPFGRSKGKRMSEVSDREWEYFATLPVRTDKEGKPYPATLQNAALRLLGRPPLSSKPDEQDEDDEANDTPRYTAPPPRGNTRPPAAAHEPVDDEPPF